MVGFEPPTLRSAVEGFKHLAYSHPIYYNSRAQKPTLMVELWALLSSIWPSLITNIGIAALISVDPPSQTQLPVPSRCTSCHRWSVMSTLHESTLANREASFESRKASYESWKTSSKKQKITFRAVDCFCKYLAHGFVVHKFLKVPGALLTHLPEFHLGLQERFVQVFQSSSFWQRWRKRFPQMDIIFKDMYLLRH